MDDDLTKDRYVVKSNDLIEAHYSLNLNQQKIILILASLCNPKDIAFEEVKIDTMTLSKLIGLDGKNYTYLKKVTRSLNGCVIELVKKNGKGLKQAPWMSYAEYFDDEGMVALKLNDAIRPFILQLNGHFTKYKRSSVIHLSSVYSIRIYELLMQYKKIGKRIFLIDDLRKILGIDDGKLPRWVDFKRRVLDTAKQELVKKTDIKFSYAAIKTGRSFNKIEFEIFDNKAVAGKISNDIDIEVEDVININALKNKPFDRLTDDYGSDDLTAFVLNNLSSNSADDLQVVLAQDFSINTEDSIKLINDHGKEKLWEKYHYYHYKKSTTEIKNPTAWFINAVIKDYSTADMKQATTLDIDWSDFNPEETRLTDLKNELKRLNDALKEAQENLASPVSQYSSALREQYQREIKDTQAKIANIQKEIVELESRVN
ncbi:MAG: RepB family plasmid replication initiator protein [Proteobacteria bacterium]|nr:RepB family plasmid replication initiator protein [Pseudomonadota bacterium]